MVLKRLFITALGALGLGALAAGPAAAQQIPAPDFYGDAIACANGFGQAGMAPKTHPIDAATKNQSSLTDAVLSGLNGTSMGCDVDDDSTASVTETDDVASGLAKARELYKKAYDAKELYDANDSAANKAALDAAVKERDDFAGGADTDTIYARVYAEEQARMGFLDSGAAWNKAKATQAKSQQLVDKVEYADFIGSVGFDSSGGDTSTQALITFKYVEDINNDGTTTTNDNFLVLYDAKGNPLQPTATGTGDNITYTSPVTSITLWDHTGDRNNEISSGANVTTVGTGASAKRYLTIVPTTADIRVLDYGDTNNTTFKFGDFDHDDDPDTDALLGVDGRKAAANKGYEGASEAVANNKDETKAPGLKEAERKWKAVSEFLDGQSNAAYTALANGKLGYTGDNPLTPDTTETGAQDYSSADYRAYKATKDSVDSALATLKSAYDGRVAATGKVEDGLKDTGAYLEQLVELREFEDAEAKAVVTKAGDDVTDAETKAAEDAADALTEAQGQLKAYEDLQALGDDSPVKGLVTSLLAADGSKADDDGQALVDAISSTYDTAKDAKDTADGVAKDVADLTGDTGRVAMNTAAIEKNAGDITALDGRVTQNEADILTNAGNIMTNAENIAANTTMIGENRGMIETNAGNITANSGRIDANATAIGANTGAIADNANAIGSNSAAIQRNSGMIGELSESLETVRAGVAASMALAGMPAINGRGISIGVGSFDGESAFAVGFMIQSEMASFKVGVTSAGGATGASAGVGFQF